MRLSPEAFGLDARFKDFIWLAPFWSAVVGSVVVALVMAVSVAIGPEGALAGLVFLPFAFFTGLMVAFAVTLMIALFTYVPSVLVWVTAFRLSSRWLGEQAAAQVAAAATALLAAIICSLLLGFASAPRRFPQGSIEYGLMIVPVSVIVSTLVARRIFRQPPIRATGAP